MGLTLVITDWIDKKNSVLVCLSLKEKTHSEDRGCLWRIVSVSWQCAGNDGQYQYLPRSHCRTELSL